MVIDIHPCEMERFNRDFAAFVEKTAQELRRKGYPETEIQRASYTWHDDTVEAYWRANQHRYLHSGDRYGWRRWNAEPWLSDAQKQELDQLYDVVREETVAEMRQEGRSRQEIRAMLDYGPGQIAHDFWEAVKPRYWQQARRAA